MSRMNASTVAAARSIDPTAARAVLAGLGAGDALLLQGNLTGEATVAALEEARARGVATVLNPSPMQPGFAAMLPLVDLLVLNESEGAQLGGSGEPETIASIQRDELQVFHKQHFGPKVLTVGVVGGVPSIEHFAAEITSRFGDWASEAERPGDLPPVPAATEVPPKIRPSGSAASE